MEFGHYWLKRRLVFAFRAQGERLGAARGRAAPIPLSARRRAPGCAELRSNRQCISVGNVDANDPAALILMDYPNRWCLKLYAHAD
jgi:hypothetical protein